MNLKFLSSLWLQATVLVTLGALTACGEKAATTSASQTPIAEEKVLNIYNWSDYIAETTLAEFQKETGIKVNYSIYDSNETLEAKLLAGSSGYDVVVPSGPFLEKQIKAGVYQKLDKSKLTYLSNLDPDIMQRLQLHDPANEHAVNYMWGTTGVGYNVDKIKKLMPDAPLDSWRMVFDPAVVKNFKSCGVTVLDSPSEITDMVLAYLGKNPNSENPDDLKQVEATLLQIRPYIKYIHSSRYITDLASGEICIAVGYNGDILQARANANDLKSGIEIAYSVPKEGSIIWFDNMAIPKDAPHPNNAHLFINYMLRPEAIAAVSNMKKFANGNQAATPFVDEAVRNDPNVYAPPEVRTRLSPNLAKSDEFTRLQTRMWTRFSTGQ